jgi:urease accessory protein UreF
MYMDNISMLEMKSKLAAMPVLQEHLKKLDTQIDEAENEVDSLLKKYEKESLDVEQIKGSSLSAMILKLVGKYDDRVDKEFREMLHAKAEHDAAVTRMAELKHEREELGRRLSDLIRDKRIYEAELRKREEQIKSRVADAVSAEYRKLEDEQDLMYRQLAETEEALRAADRVRSTARSAMDYLDDVEGRATYDIWFSKGLISHMAKYDRIDGAQEQMDRLRSHISDLKRELKDIDPDIGFSPSSIDFTTRAIDFWFDNIFTDMAVRGQIRDNMDQISSLILKTDRIIEKLNGVKSDINHRIRKIERKKNELLLSFEG